MNTKRIFLSPPHLSGRELVLVEEAFASNYIAPCGPMVEAFEQEFAAYVGIPHCLALSSGTAAVHLALRQAIVMLAGRAAVAGRLRPVVLASSLTFIGSVSPAVFEGCELRFIDSDRLTWNMDTRLLEDELLACQDEGRQVAAVVPTDIYGQCCDLPGIAAICGRFGVPVICDSAEAVGARYQVPGEGGWRHAGYGALAAVYSFNGNKIITSSGGGMLASHDRELITHARKLSTQAREPAPHYEHAEIGYNYRMSNIVAAVGRGQLEVVDERVRRKREIFAWYRDALGDVPGLSFMPEAAYCQANRWLTVMLIDAERFGATPDQVRLALEAENIESRPVWKPMHLQPVFAECRVRGGAVSEELFHQGLCLPSGTALTDAELARIVAIIRKSVRR